MLSAFNLVSFDTSDLLFHDETPVYRRWLTTESDTVRLAIICPPQELPVSMLDLNEYRSWLVKDLSPQMGLIEAAVVEIDGRPTSRVILKEPTEKGGMIFTGLLETPFPRWTSSLAIYCSERGTTGIRESIVLQECVAAGKVRPDPAAQKMHGWATHPYFPEICEGIVRNLADLEEHDSRFPDHPLSRLRRLLDRFQTKMAFKESAASYVGAAIGSGHQKKPPWWKFW